MWRQFELWETELGPPPSAEALAGCVFIWSLPGPCHLLPRRRLTKRRAWSYNSRTYVRLQSFDGWDGIVGFEAGLE